MYSGGSLMHGRIHDALLIDIRWREFLDAAALAGNQDAV
jgi:hypothetical protein